MKTLIALVVLSVAVPILACPKGSSPYKDTCVYDLAPEIAAPVKPSDEVPPSDKMPSWQREGIKIVDAPNMDAEDRKLDQEKIDATAEGRRKAGIRAPNPPRTYNPCQDGQCDK